MNGSTWYAVAARASSFCDFACRRVLDAPQQQYVLDAAASFSTTCISVRTQRLPSPPAVRGSKPFLQTYVEASRRRTCLVENAKAVPGACSNSQWHVSPQEEGVVQTPPIHAINFFPFVGLPAATKKHCRLPPAYRCTTT